MDSRILEFVSLFGKRFASGILACAMMMTWGNVLTLTVEHLKTAATVGAVGAVILLLYLKIMKNTDTDDKKRMAILSGVTVALADFMVHPSSFLMAIGEPVATGLLAGAIAYSMSKAKLYLIG